jgi:hypothetical protein
VQKKLLDVWFISTDDQVDNEFTKAQVDNEFTKALSHGRLLEFQHNLNLRGDDRISQRKGIIMCNRRESCTFCCTRT